MRKFFIFLFVISISVVFLVNCHFTTLHRSNPDFAIKEKSFAAGYSHSCFIKNDDTVMCFDGHFFNPDDATFEDINKTPIKAKALTAGIAHTCAILLDNTVYCWNDKRKVDYGWEKSINLRANFNVIEHRKVLDIAAGYFHTCVITEKNQIACFGDNSQNKIDNIMTQFAGVKVKSIWAGSENLCAIKMDDTMMCSDGITAGFF
jgi:alpha-tubulin suppressor-like RCC1 family protein